MKNASRFLTCAVFLCGAVAVLAQGKPNEDALALLRSVARQYRDAKTYHFEMVRERTVSSDLSRSWSKQLYTLAKGTSGEYRYEIKDQNGWHVNVSDGETEWQIQPWKNEYVRNAVAKEGPADEVSPKPSQPTNSPTVTQSQYMLKRMATLDEALVSAEITGTEVIRIGDREYRCTLVTAEYRPPRMMVAKIRTTNTFWVDTDTKLVRKEHVVEHGELFPSQPLADGSGDGTLVWTIAEVNTTPSSKLFRYQPDATSRMVDRLTSTFVRSNLTGDTAPALNLKRVDGTEVSPELYKGKVLVIDFWASYCAPCIAQMPFIAKLHNDYKEKGVLVVGVNKDPDRKKAIAFLEKSNYDWLNLYDEKVEASKPWGTDAVPTFAVVDSSGKIALFRVGYNSKDEADIRAMLDKLISKTE